MLERTAGGFCSLKNRCLGRVVARAARGCGGFAGKQMTSMNAIKSRWLGRVAARRLRFGYCILLPDLKHIMKYGIISLIRIRIYFEHEYGL